MTPAARLAAAIEALETFEREDAPADRLLAAWGRANRYAGSKDRAAVADLFYAMLRRRRSLAWPLRADTPRAAAIGLVLAEGGDPAALFDGARHGPAPLTADERAALAEPPPLPPDPVRLDYPDWLDAPLRASLGPAFEASMAALQERAPVDMRVNRLKVDLATARVALAEDGVEAAPVPGAPLCLRAAPGARVVRSRAYAEGLVELQDAASQRAALFAEAQPGETVLDFCAGGGGKTLALAAELGGRGRVIAWDAAPARMKDLPARAARAGAEIGIADAPALEALRGGCDLVFVDAPCSGSGAWRRDPGGKWRLTPERLAALRAQQAAVLAEAAAFAAPGGRILYVTCSLLADENAPPAPSGWAVARRLALTPADGADGFGCLAFEPVTGRLTNS
jgi:16S rRNA (cytosine967-C5)-methyltransferase